MRKFLSVVLLLTSFSLVAFSQTTHQEKMMEREAQYKAEMAAQNNIQKVKPFGEPMQATKAANKAGALPVIGKRNVSVLVATPNEQDFNDFIIPIMMNDFEGVDYTVTKNLGGLTVENMLEYDVVFTFNVSKWDYETGTTRVAWSNKLYTS